jgi:hypothetical protein
LKKYVIRSKNEQDALLRYISKSDLKHDTKYWIVGEKNLNGDWSIFDGNAQNMLFKNLAFSPTMPNDNKCIYLAIDYGENVTISCGTNTNSNQIICEYVKEA